MYDEKIAAAKAVADAHNAALGEIATGNKIEWDKFLFRLKLEGGTTDEGLKECSWEDLKEYGLPRQIAKQVARIFRGSDSEEKPASGAPLTVETRADKLKAMKAEELIGQYDPHEPASDIADEIRRRLGSNTNKRFIVFNSDGKVNVTATIELFEEVRKGYPERTLWKTADDTQPTYKLGEFPDEIADECPVHKGEALLPDGTCPKLERKWTAEPGDRVTVRIIVDMNNGLSSRDIHELLDFANKGTLTDALERFPRTIPRRKELESLGQLPTLKVKRGSTSGGTGSDTPFLHRQF